MKPRTNRYLAVAILLSVFSGCTSNNPVAAKQDYIYHVVVAWLKQPGDTEAQQALIDGTKSLRDIPGVITVSAGRTFASERAVVDDSFDVALTIVLKDQAALASYQNHPIHNKVKSEILKPLVARYIVYNYVD